jgi:hypothetical protein
MLLETNDLGPLWQGFTSGSKTGPVGALPNGRDGGGDLSSSSRELESFFIGLPPSLPLHRATTGGPAGVTPAGRGQARLQDQRPWR